MSRPHQLLLTRAKWMTAMGHSAVIRPGALSDGNAAVAVGRVRTSNSRFRPHCSRSGPSVATPATSGIKGTADIAGGASARTRSPTGQSSASAADWRRSKPNVCCSSTRQVATDPQLPVGHSKYRRQSRHSRSTLGDWQRQPSLPAQQRAGFRTHPWDRSLIERGMLSERVID
jgi:hypothetical protein